jgi:hypothetical protein
MLSRQEVPALAVAAPRARGTLNGLMIKRHGRMVLTYSLNYRHLTSRATAAHLQIGAAGTAGPIVVTLCAPCGLTAGGAKLLPPKAVQAIRNGTAYVNVHTRKNPKGEIRGQLRIVS